MKIAIISIIILLILMTLWVPNKKFKITFGVVAVVVLFFFLQVSSISIGQGFDVQDKSGQFKFTLVPSKGRDTDMMHKRLESFKKKYYITEDVILYRTMTINYFNVSMWSNYSNNPYWKLDYIEQE